MAQHSQENYPILLLLKDFILENRHHAAPCEGGPFKAALINLE
jgi:hypothetical protein